MLLLTDIPIRTPLFSVVMLLLLLLPCRLREDSTASTNDFHCLLVRSIQRGPVPVTLSASLCISGRSEVVVRCRVPAIRMEHSEWFCLSQIFPLCPPVLYPHKAYVKHSYELVNRLVNFAPLLRFSTHLNFYE